MGGNRFASRIGPSHFFGQSQSVTPSHTFRRRTYSGTMKSPCDGRSAHNHHPKHTSTCPASQQFFWILFYFFLDLHHHHRPPSSSSSADVPSSELFVFLLRQHRCNHYSTDSETKRGTRQKTKAAHAAAETTWDTSRDEDNDEDPPPKTFLHAHRRIDWKDGRRSGARRPKEYKLQG